MKMIKLSRINGRPEITNTAEQKLWLISENVFTFNQPEHRYGIRKSLLLLLIHRLIKCAI